MLKSFAAGAPMHRRKRVVALVVPGILCVIGSLLMVFNGWLWLRSPRKRLCPGPRLHWRQRLLPLWLVFLPRCGYDLSGHTLRAGKAITCPECGRILQHRRQMIRTTRAWRPANLGGAFILAGLLVHRYPPLAATTVVQYSPTDLLLRGEGLLGAGTPLEVREEIRRRAMDHQLSDDQIARYVQLLVNDLRDDALAGNAKAAIEHLAIFGVFFAEPLMASLNSGDSQQRALAAEVLRGLPDPCVDRATLIRVSVEDLRGSQWPGTRSDAQRYLYRHIEQARPLLIEALRSEDEAQRSAAASLLRHTETDGATLDTLLRIDMEDLRDDDRRGNAGHARWHLYAHREAAKPLLIAALDGEDQQQRDAAIWILRQSSVDGEPLRRLLRISLERLGAERHRTRLGEEFAFLLRHAAIADSLLMEGMLGDDPQRRLRYAHRLGGAGHRHPRTSPCG